MPRSAAPDAAAPPVGRALCALAGALPIALGVAVAARGDGFGLLLVMAFVAAPPIALAARPPRAARFRALAATTGLGLLALGLLAFFFGGLVLAPSAALVLLAAMAPRPGAAPAVRILFGLGVAAIVVLAWLLIAG